MSELWKVETWWCFGYRMMEPKSSIYHGLRVLFYSRYVQGQPLRWWSGATCKHQGHVYRSAYIMHSGNSGSSHSCFVGCTKSRIHDHMLHTVHNHRKEITFEILHNSDGTYWKKKLRGCLRKTTGLYSQSLHPFQQYSSPRYFSHSLPLHYADKIEEFIVCHCIPYDIENVRSCLKHAIP